MAEVAHLLDVGHAEGALHGGGAAHGRGRFPREVGLELLHPGAGEERGGVAHGHERPRGQVAMIARPEEIEEGRANLVGAPRGIGHDGPPMLPRRRPGVSDSPPRARLTSPDGGSSIGGQAIAHDRRPRSPRTRNRPESPIPAGERARAGRAAGRRRARRGAPRGDALGPARGAPCRGGRARRAVRHRRRPRARPPHASPSPSWTRPRRARRWRTRRWRARTSASSRTPPGRARARPWRAAARRWRAATPCSWRGATRRWRTPTCCARCSPRGRARRWPSPRRTGARALGARTPRGCGNASARACPTSPGTTPRPWRRTPTPSRASTTARRWRGRRRPCAGG